MGFIRNTIATAIDFAIELLVDEPDEQGDHVADDEDFYNPVRASHAYGVDVNGVTMDHDWHTKGE